MRLVIVDFFYNGNETNIFFNLLDDILNVVFQKDQQ